MMVKEAPADFLYFTIGERDMSRQRENHREIF